MWSGAGCDVTSWRATCCGGDQLCTRGCRYVIYSPGRTHYGLLIGTGSVKKTSPTLESLSSNRCPITEHSKDDGFFGDFFFDIISCAITSLLSTVRSARESLTVGIFSPSIYHRQPVYKLKADHDCFWLNLVRLGHRRIQHFRR